MTADPRLALVVGYDRLGAVARLAGLLHRYGRGRVVALVNRSELLEDAARDAGFTLIEVPDILDGRLIARAVESVPGFSAHTPFLCVQDRPAFAWLEARAVTAGPGGHPNSPTDGHPKFAHPGAVAMTS